MNLGSYGVNFRTASVELRERLALDDAARDAMATELAGRFSVETTVLSTCNRTELYLGRPSAWPAGWILGDAADPGGTGRKIVQV